MIANHQKIIGSDAVRPTGIGRWAKRARRNFRSAIFRIQDGAVKSALLGMVVVLAIVNTGLLGLIMRQPVDAATTVSLDFSTDTVKDSGPTTANWNTSAGNVTLPTNPAIQFSGTISSDLNPSTVVPDVAIYGVSFVSSSTGYVVGDSGYLWKTTDSGTNWTALTRPEAAVTIKDIDCTDATTCWVVNDNGNIWKTTNSGVSWTQSSAAGEPLFDIVMVDATTGWAVGGSVSEIILRTTDGTNWVSKPASTGYGIRQVTATSSLDAIIQIDTSGGGSGAVYTTHNGGSSWQASNMGGTTGAAWGLINGHTLFASPATTSVYLGDTLTGGVNTRALRSGDGGSTFTTMTTGLTGSVTALGASSDGEKVVACQIGACKYSTNGGGTWSASTIVGTLSVAYAVEFVSATSLYLTAPDTSGNFAYSMDGGANIIVAAGSTGSGSWPTASNIKAVAPSKTASSTVVLGFDATSGYRRSTDDFSNVTTPTGLDGVVRDAECTDTNCVAGTSGGTYYSTNGGTSWTQATINGSGAFSAATNAVTMYGTGTAYAVTEGATTGAIYRSTDGGATWDSVSTLADSSFLSVDCASATTCWAVSIAGDVATFAGKDGDYHISAGGGGGGTTAIYGTTNGTTWTSQKDLGADSFTPSQIAAISSTRVIVVGAACPGFFCIGSYVTTDGGTTWGSFDIDGAGSTPTTVACNSGGNCFAGGASGYLIYSNDSGTSWTAQASGLGTADVKDIEFGDDYRAYLSSSLRGIKKLSLAAGAVTYQTPKTVRTTALDATSDAITDATLTVTATTPANTTITSYLSNDGGTTWTAATPGVALTFSTAGSDLRYRADLAASDNTVTPTLDSISISFNTLVVTQAFTAGGLQMSRTGDASLQIYPVSISDGGTGTISAWTDDFSGVTNIYAQRMSSAGAAQWTSGGVRIAASSSAQFAHRIVTDGSGGAIITWGEDAAGAEPSHKMMAVHLDASGNKVWETTTADSGSNSYCVNHLVSDGSGGAILSYTYASDSYTDYVQHIASSGTVLWTTKVSTFGGTSGACWGSSNLNNGTGHMVVNAATGKLFVAATPFALAGGGTVRVYVQQIDLTTGLRDYGTDGVVVDHRISETGVTPNIRVIGIGTDGSTGFHVATLGYNRVGEGSNYVSILRTISGSNSSMTTTTIANHADVGVSFFANNGGLADAVGDSSGNLFVAWHALNAGSERLLLVNKVAPTGTNIWGSAVTGPGGSIGTALTVKSATGMFPRPQIMPDTAGGAYVSWLNVSDTESIDVRMQHINGSGALVWPSASQIIGSGPADPGGSYYHHRIVVMSASSAWLAWDEDDVFVQSVVESAGAGSSNPASSSSGTTEGSNTVPLNPKAGTPEARNTTTIRWKFTDRSNFETGFQLREEKPGNNNPRIIFTTEPIETKDLTYIDETGLLPNTQYCYRVVRTLNDKGLSAATALACTYTLANPPKDVLVTSPSAVTRLLTWGDNGNTSSTKYAIFEKNSGLYVNPNGSLDKTPFWQTRDGWGGDAGILVQGLDATKDYVFQIFSKNGDGKESLPVTAGIGVPSNEQVGGVANLVVKKSVAINPFGAALAAVSAAAGGVSAVLFGLFALAVMAFAVLHRRAGAGLCIAGVCRFVRSPAYSYVSTAKTGPSTRMHRGVHRTGQITGIAALIALLVQAAATSVLTFAPQFTFAAQTFTGDGNAVATGDTLSYQIQVENDGNASATSIALSDALPIGLAYQAGSLTVNGIKQSDACDNDAACFNVTNKTVSLTYPSIGPGDSLILALNTTVTIKPGLGNDLVILRNSACATAKQLANAVCSNETMNPVTMAAVVNGNVNQLPTNANQNVNVPPTTNVNRQPVSDNINQPQTNVNANQNANINENTNVNAPVGEPPTPPVEKTTQITINGVEPSTDTPTTDSTPNIEGTSAPGSLVLLTIDNRVAGVAYAGKDGRFSFTPDKALTEGTHTVTVSLDGVVFDTTQFAVDTVPPEPPVNLDIVILKVSLSIRALIVSGETRGQDATIVISGHTSPDTSLVKIRVESDPIEVSFVPPATDWSREITGRFDPGTHTVTALAYDAAGNVSASAVKTFEIPEPTVLASPLALLDDPQVEAVATISAPILPAIAALNVALATGIPTLFNFLGLLLTQPALLFARKEKKGYGTIFNALSKLPIDLAIVRIRDQNTNRILQTKVTDRLGRYVFFLNPGAFAVEVTKQGFVHPSQYLSGKTEDVAYTDLFAANALSLSENTRLAKNIPLDPLESQKTPAAILRTLILRRLQYAFALTGPVVSVVAFVITPTLLAGALLLLQVVMFVLFRRLAYKKPPKSFGIIRDETTGKPIKNAVIRIFETTYNKLLETQVTDARGRYAFLVGQSRYYVTAQAAGYATVSTEPIDFSSIQKGGLVARDITLGQGAELPPSVPTAPPAPPVMPSWTPPPAPPASPLQTPPTQQ